MVLPSKLSSLTMLLCSLLLLISSSVSFSPIPAFKRSVLRSNVNLFGTKKTFSSFDEMISTYEEPLFVDFYADWCGPCQLMSKEVSSLSNTYEGKLKVAKVDTDKYPDLEEKYKIDGLPTCILFKKGKEVKRFVGLMKEEELKPHIEPFLD